MEKSRMYRQARLALFLAAGAALVVAGGCGAPGGQFRELTEVGSYARVLGRSDTPVLVEFYKSGCPACMGVAPMLAELSDEYADQAAFLAVERGRGADIRRRYDIRAYPTVIVFVEGRERARLVNERSTDVYREALDAAIAEARTFSPAQGTPE